MGFFSYLSKSFFELDEASTEAVDSLNVIVNRFYKDYAVDAATEHETITQEPGSSPLTLSDMLAISQPLQGHPMLAETRDVKIRYISILEYFVNTYGKDNLFASSALRSYKQAILGDAFPDYVYAYQDSQSKTETFSKIRSQAYFLSSNRFILAMDVLFLCAFGDPEKGRIILQRVEDIFYNRYRTTWDISYHAQSSSPLNDLYEVLYHRASASLSLASIYPQLEFWADNRSFLEQPLSTTLFVATMSAGKSTLINALVGKKVNRSQNQACTAKLHYIYNKAFEDGFSYEYDYLLDLNADDETLMTDNEDNTTNEIMVGTFFRFAIPTEKRLCLLDTPGANFSGDATHSEISHNAIQNADYDTLVYVLNAGQLGINDDFTYLRYVKEHCRKNCRLIFLLNKVDEFNGREDSIANSMGNIRADLKEIGFTDYQLYPVSGYAGYIAKDIISGRTYSPTDPEFFGVLALKARFNNPSFDCSRYYNTPSEAIRLARESFPNHPEEVELLLRSGLLGLEYALTH